MQCIVYIRVRSGRTLLYALLVCMVAQRVVALNHLLGSLMSLYTGVPVGPGRLDATAGLSMTSSCASMTWRKSHIRIAQ